MSNNWDKKIETKIADVGETCCIYRKLYILAGIKYEKYDKIFTISIIILSSGLSVMSVFELNEPNTYNIIKSIITYIITVITVIQLFTNTKEISIHCKNLSSNFGILFNKIQTMLLLNQEKRDDGIYFLYDVIKEYDNLLASSSQYSNLIKSKYVSMMNTEEISISTSSTENYTSSSTNSKNSQLHCFIDICAEKNN